jgi:hypothetical protein
MGVRLAYILIKKLVTMCTTPGSMLQIVFCFYDDFLINTSIFVAQH